VFALIFAFFLAFYTWIPTAFWTFWMRARYCAFFIAWRAWFATSFVCTFMIAWIYFSAFPIAISVENLTLALITFFWTRMSAFQNFIAFRFAFQILYRYSTIYIIFMSARKKFLNSLFAWIYISFFQLIRIKFIAIKWTFSLTLMTAPQ